MFFSRHKCLSYSFSRFIWLPMSWVYGHLKKCYFFSAGIDFRGQNLTSPDVRFWRLKSVPARKRLIYHLLRGEKLFIICRQNEQQCHDAESIGTFFPTFLSVMPSPSISRSALLPLYCGPGHISQSSHRIAMPGQQTPQREATGARTIGLTSPQIVK